MVKKPKSNKRDSASKGKARNTGRDNEEIPKRKKMNKEPTFVEEDSGNEGEEIDVGSKRIEIELDEDLLMSDEEAVVPIESDPYHTWFHKRKFGEQERQNAEDIVNSYTLQNVAIDSDFQCKKSSNGLEDIEPLLSNQQIGSIKGRLLSQCEPFFSSIMKNPRLLSIYQTISHYHDVLYASNEELATENEHNDLLLKMICGHALNHIMKANDIENDHTSTIRMKKRMQNEQTHEIIRKKQAEKGKHTYHPLSEIDLDSAITIPTYQDQGFTRPKVLILCPFRYHAFRIVNQIIELLPKKVGISGKPKFEAEFEEEPEEEGEKAAKWKQFFPGNNDDCFRLGLSINGRNFKLFSDFYNSDIIIASPLALKQLETKRGYDYLSSIEVIIVYGSDMINMQNPEHLKSIIEGTNQTISRDRNTDFSRLREYFLNDQQKYMRQTIMVGKIVNSTILGLFHRSCFNPIGRLEIRPVYEGSVSEILTPPRQLFLRVTCADAIDINTSKIKYIESNVLKLLNNASYGKILLYCDNYFEYIYTKRLLMENCDERECGIIDEYLDHADNLRNRSYFYSGTIRVLLFSGRLMYFKRLNIRGANSVYFVGLPSYPEFYSEIVNAMNHEDKGQLSVGVTVLYSKVDTYALERVVGTNRYKKMLTGKRDMFIFC